METISLFSGVLLFSLLCLLPEVRAIKSRHIGFYPTAGHGLKLTKCPAVRNIH